MTAEFPFGMRFRSTWDGARAYALQEVVIYNGITYIAAQSGTNHQPDTSPTFWTAIGGAGSGAQGFQGAQGAQGAQGVTGAGFQGATGAQGAQGAAGSAGAAGSTGATGATGPQGAQGASGSQGAQGTVGGTGPQGPQGFQGPQGSQGFQGFQGVQGFQGNAGNPSAIDVTTAPYNAKADERLGTNGQMTQGSPVLQGSGFSSADVGKTVSVWKTQQITNLMWTAGTNIVSSASFSIGSAANIGRLLQIWGDGPLTIASVIDLHTVTLSGIPGGAVNVVNGTGEMSVGLLTTIASFTDSTHVTLASNWTQNTSISSANYAVATDDSNAFNTALSALSAAGGGTLTGPAKTYRVQEISIPSNCELQFPPGTVFKLAYDANSTRNCFKITTGGSTDTTYITNVAFRGRGGMVDIDQSDLQPGSGPTRAITIINASRVLVENVRGIGLPANSGNVVHLASNSVLTTPTDITIRRLRHEQVRHVGNSAIQVDAVDGLRADDIWVDGGVALRLECAQHDGDIVQNVRASRLRAGGENGQPHSAFTTTGHQNRIRNVTVDGFRALGGATGHSYTYTPHTGGTPNLNLYPLERIAVRGGLVDGGGAGVDNGAPFDSGTNNIQTDTVTWQDIKVSGAIADAFNHAGGTFIRCKAEGSTTRAGFTAVGQDGVANSQNAAPPLGITARFFGCHAKGNLTYGWDCKNHQQYEFYGCTADDPTIITTSGANLLSAANIDLETGLGGWNSITNAAVAQTTAQSYTGTHSLRITSVAAGSAEVHTASGTSGFAVTAGSIYKATAWIRSAVSAADCFVSIRWYGAGGGFISQQGGPTITDVANGWTQLSVLATAPVGATFAGLKISVIATGSAEVHYSDQHQVFLTTATSLPTQLFGIHGISGQNVYVHGGDFTHNGLGATAGAANFVFTPLQPGSQSIVDGDISPTAGIQVSKLLAGPVGQYVTSDGTTTQWGSAPGSLYSQGVESSRPSASGVSAGYHYFSTDTHALWESDGATWTLISYDWFYLRAGMPSGTFRPTYPRDTIGSQSLAIVAGTLYVVGVELLAGDVISTLSWMGGNNAMTGGTTAGTKHLWSCLTDGSYGVLGYSADEADASAWAQGAQKDHALVFNGAGGGISSVTIATTGHYFYCILVNSGAGGSPAMPTLVGKSFQGNNIAQGILGQPHVSDRVVGQAYPPSSTLTSISTSPTIAPYGIGH